MADPFANAQTMSLAQSFGFNPRVASGNATHSSGMYLPGGSAGNPTGPLTPTPTVDPSAYAQQFKSIFGAPQYIDPMTTASQIQSITQNALARQKPVPAITAPVVTPAQIQLPGGLSYEQYAKDLFNKEFLPVQQEIGRQSAQADKALSGQLAQAGLADSGSGVAQRELRAENFDTYLQNAAMDMSAAAGSTAAQAEFGVLSANAQLAQQASLANAGFNLTAQTATAQNILTQNAAIQSSSQGAVQGYLAALGINAQQAQSYRDSFVRFIGQEESREGAKDAFRLNAQSTYLNFVMQQRALDQRHMEAEQQNNISAVRNALDSEQIDNQFNIAMAQINGANWRQGMASSGGSGAGGMQQAQPKPPPEPNPGTPKSNSGTNTNPFSVGGPSQEFAANNFGNVFGPGAGDPTGFLDSGTPAVTNSGEVQASAGGVF